MLMPGERPSQHGHSSNPSTTFSGPSSLNVSTTLCSLMVILLCPLPLLRQGVFSCCAPIAHHFSGATPSPKTQGLHRDPDAGARNLQSVTSAALGASASAVARLQWRAPAT